MRPELGATGAALMRARGLGNSWALMFISISIFLLGVAALDFGDGVPNPEPRPEYH
jgi:hypothetical protein